MQSTVGLSSPAFLSLNICTSETFGTNELIIIEIVAIFKIDEEEIRRFSKYFPLQLMHIAE